MKKNRQYEKFSLNSFNRQIIAFTKRIDVENCALELSKVLLYQGYYSNMGPIIREDNVDFFMCRDTFKFSFIPIKSLTNDLKHFSKNWHISDLYPSLHQCSE